MMIEPNSKETDRQVPEPQATEAPRAEQRLQNRSEDHDVDRNAVFSDWASI